MIRDSRQEPASHVPQRNRITFSRTTLCASRSTMSRALNQSTFSPRRQPFLYLTIVLVAGILVDRWTCPARLEVTAFLVIATATSISLVLLKKEAFATVALLVSFVACGLLLSATERSEARRVGE